MTQPPPNAGSTDEETTRPQRPFSVRQEVGEGFILGSVLGSAYHFPKGGFQAIYTKAPRVGAYYAVFMGAYEAIEGTMVYARRKEEPVLNSAVGVAGAAGIVTMPKGVRAAACAALMGAAFGWALGIGEGMFDRYQRRKLSLPQAGDNAPAFCPTCFPGGVPDKFPETPPVVAQ